MKTQKDLKNIRDFMKDKFRNSTFHPSNHKRLDVIRNNHKNKKFGKAVGSINSLYIKEH